MPPRTRSTTTTAPAGRRPKVAGLRAPGRRGVTGESGPAAVGPTDVDPDDVRVDGTEDLDRPEAPAAPTPSAVADPDDAGATTAAGTAATGEAATADPSDAPPAGDRDGGAARPTPKARRAGRSMTPAAPEAGPRRGGTALLERPAPARTAASAEPAGDSRVGRIAAAVTRPFAALGANPRRLITVLVVVLVLSLGLGTWAFVAARSDRADGAPYANAAVVDVGGTAEVVGQTRQAMEQILSYDFTKLDDSVNAAKSQATGSFASEYLSVFEQTIRKPATDQKLRQTATVLNIGVQQLSSDRATLMALVQFTAERTTNGQTTNAPGLLSVQVVKEDGRWKISELKPV
jgi:Mce-associated membrane protein